MLFGQIRSCLSCIQHWMPVCLFSRSGITSCNQVCSGSNNMAAQIFRKIIYTEIYTK